MCFQQSVISAHWLNDGKQFMCSHADGTLTIWSLKSNDKPVEILTPHSESCFYNCYCCPPELHCSYINFIDFLCFNASKRNHLVLSIKFLICQLSFKHFFAPNCLKFCAGSSVNSKNTAQSVLSTMIKLRDLKSSYSVYVQ